MYSRRLASVSSSVCPLVKTASSSAAAAPMMKIRIGRESSTVEYVAHALLRAAFTLMGTRLHTSVNAARKSACATGLAHDQKHLVGGREAERFIQMPAIGAGMQHNVIDSIGAAPLKSGS